MYKSDKIYDYVIVGGGSAGCVLAGRLSANSSQRVLLVEAGSDFQPDDLPPQLQDGFAGVAYNNLKFIWNDLKVKAGPRLGNAPDHRSEKLYQQGRVIGGGSSINGMMANRGSPLDYEEWAESGAIGWGWDDVLPYFKKLESDHDFDGPFHGKTGPVGVRRLFPDVWPGYTAGVMAAAAAEGFDYHADMNAEVFDGYFPVSISNIDNKRVSANVAYLTKQVRSRDNLDILDKAELDHLVFEGRRVTGLRIRRADEQHLVSAKETIICAGATHSPAILMRSGIGPASQLSHLGITIVADRPGVGQNLMEHPGVSIAAFMKPVARLKTGMRRQMIACLRYSSGIEGCGPGDMFIVPTNKVSWHALGDRLGATLVWVNNSFSTGEVTLISSNPLDEPKVDFNMCSDERDLTRLVQATRFIARLHTDPAVNDIVEEVFPASYSERTRRLNEYNVVNAVKAKIAATVMDLGKPFRKGLINKVILEGPTFAELLKDDSVIEEWIKSTVTGTWHASCTCRMGREDDPLAVTDSEARVYGVDGLRVCDASIMPRVPRANTNIPIMMMAEKLSDQILAAI